MNAIEQYLYDKGRSEAMGKCVHEHANASRVIDWMKDPKRNPAITAFTEGPERRIAYEFERVVSVALNKASAGMQSTMTRMAHEWVVKAKAEAYEIAAKIAEGEKVEMGKDRVTFDPKCIRETLEQPEVALRKMHNSVLDTVAEELRQKAKEVGRV